MGCCNVVAIQSMADMVCLDCIYAETVQCMSSPGSVWYVGFKLPYIAENFRGRKHSQISRFCGDSRKFSLRNLGA